MISTDTADAIEFLQPEFLATTPESTNELEEAITGLWSAHTNAKRTARATNEELRVIRATLGAQLCRLKELLAKPGRGGQWSSFLEERQIPRATADRLVARHLRSLNPDVNCITESNREPTDDEVQKLFFAVWPKLRRTLTTQQSVHLFINLLTSYCPQSEPADHEIPVVAESATTNPPSSAGDSFIPSEWGAGLSPASDALP
jgi:hypothetical protein